jgi:hypothetical protein
MSRYVLALLGLTLAACSGCKTAEIAVNHQITGLHVVAKFAAPEHNGAPSPLAPLQANHSTGGAAHLVRLPPAWES